MSVFTTIRRSVGMSLSPQKPKPVALTNNASASGSGSSMKKKPTTSSDKGPVHGYLILENSNGVGKERYPLQKHITTIGRLHHGDIRIYGDTVSRLHCQICVDEDGKISLQIFNVRGIKLNQQKIQSMAIASESEKIISLEESDLIEIFTHRFRLEYVKRDENGRAIIPQNTRLGRKSLRMSLVRAAVSEAPLQESPAALEEAEEVFKREEKDKSKIEHRFLPNEQDKENAPMKSRRSFAPNTPTRSSTRNGPWETEPRKKKVKRLSLSPVKGASLAKNPVQPCLDLDTSIVVMEEVDEDEMIEEVQPVEVERENIDPNTVLNHIATPARNASTSSQRLTQSSSPKKPSTKARRRSSFFGRAGIFAGLNLGFYPEERRDNEEEKAVESDLKESNFSSPPPSPEKVRKIVTPEPRLDHYGMPRLPRSMSSPNGLNYGSPGKRRVISLRTATLIKTGQQTFEQQKLLSPPPSPTKTISSPSLMSAIVSSSPDKKAAAGQIPLPNSDDEEDADEVDRSLSSFLEDVEDVEEEKALTMPIFNNSKTRTIKGPRMSHGVPASHNVDTTVKSKSKGRTSLPGKLLSVSFVETSNGKTVEEWRKEWEKDAKASKKSENKSQPSLEVALSNAFDEAQDEDTDEEKGADAEEVVMNGEVEPGNDTALDKDSPQKVERLPLKLLRHMVRDNSDLTSLLDEISGDGNQKGEGHTLQEIPVREIPYELTAGAATKLSRRASEMPKKDTRRRSSVAQKTLPKKSRKSAGAVLHTKEMKCPLSIIPTKGVNGDSALVVPQQKNLVDNIGENDVLNKIVQEEEAVILQGEALPSHKEAVMPLQEEEEAFIPREKEVAAPKRSPRKRTAEPVKTQIPITSRQTRGTKNSGANILSEREASKSPQKKSTIRGKVTTLSSQRGYSDDFESDNLQSSRLLLESSSPIKRTKRAAKEQAEAKIRNVLVKKPSIAVMRDARSAPSDEIKARTKTQALPRKVKEVIHSEPTRTTRSRSAAAAAATTKR